MCRDKVLFPCARNDAPTLGFAVKAGLAFFEDREAIAKGGSFVPIDLFNRAGRAAIFEAGGVIAQGALELRLRHFCLPDPKGLLDGDLDGWGFVISRGGELFFREAHRELSCFDALRRCFGEKCDDKLLSFFAGSLGASERAIVFASAAMFGLCLEIDASTAASGLIARTAAAACLAGGPKRADLAAGSAMLGMGLGVHASACTNNAFGRTSAGSIFAGKTERGIAAVSAFSAMLVGLGKGNASLFATCLSFGACLGKPNTESRPEQKKHTQCKKPESKGYRAMFWGR